MLKLYLSSGDERRDVVSEAAAAVTAAVRAALVV
jgi:hypothetical protein